mmetsp:Transcript_12104/g.16620  ORF Transcript_12104/g.16620 Transcript_12104/m.16620 type:complete len:213 (-) Transcript_12104:1331-1969(-)
MGTKQRGAEGCQLNPSEQQLRGTNVDEGTHIRHGEAANVRVSERVAPDAATQRRHQHGLDSVVSVPTHHLIAQPEHQVLQARGVHPARPHEVHDVVGVITALWRRREGGQVAVGLSLSLEVDLLLLELAHGLRHHTAPLLRVAVVVLGRRHRGVVQPRIEGQVLAEVGHEARGRHLLEEHLLDDVLHPLPGRGVGRVQHAERNGAAPQLVGS